MGHDRTASSDPARHKRAQKMNKRREISCVATAMLGLKKPRVSTSPNEHGEEDLDVLPLGSVPVSSETLEVGCQNQAETADELDPSAIESECQLLRQEKIDLQAKVDSLVISPAFFEGKDDKVNCDVLVFDAVGAFNFDTPLSTAFAVHQPIWGCSHVHIPKMLLRS